MFRKNCEQHKQALFYHEAPKIVLNLNHKNLRLYLKELYRWAGSFTPRAEQTIGILERKRRKNEELLTDELRELIR